MLKVVSTKCLVLAIPFLFGVAGCGGGGGSSGGGSITLRNVDLEKSEVVTEFADQSGVARTEYTEAGQKFVTNVMTEEIRFYNPNSTVDVDPTGNDYDEVFVLTPTKTLAHGKVYSGATTVNGVTISIEYYQDDEGDVFAVYLDGSSITSSAIAGGHKVSGIPQAGTATYTGANFFGNRDGKNIEDGTFTMMADFGDGSATITGSTDNSSFSGNGLAINFQTGQFEGTGLTITLSDNTTLNGFIHGNFHGVGAVGVTGLYFGGTLSNDPSHAGAIAGKKSQ